MLRKYGLTTGLMIASFGLGIYIAHAPDVNAQQKKRVIEIRTYTTAEGKLDPLAKRMGTDEMKYFEKHGMTNVFFGVASDPPLSENTFVYIVSHESREAAKKNWPAVLQDPGFKELISKSGRFSVKQESIFVDPTDYSPLK
jgi:NIPSNAP